MKKIIQTNLSESRPGTEVKHIGSRVKIIEGKGLGKIGTLIAFHTVGWPGRWIGRKWVSEKELHGDDFVDENDETTKNGHRTRIGIKLDNGVIIWAWYWDCEKQEETKSSSVKSQKRRSKSRPKSSQSMMNAILDMAGVKSCSDDLKENEHPWEDEPY